MSDEQRRNLVGSTRLPPFAGSIVHQSGVLCIYYGDGRRDGNIRVLQTVPGMNVSRTGTIGCTSV